MSVSGSPVPAPYEFTPEQDGTLSKLGGKMRFVGTMTLIYGVVGLVAMISTFLTRDAAGRFHMNFDLGPIVAFFVGYWTISAGKSFQQVAQTQGHDITHLMAALERLRRIFGLLALILAIMLAIVSVVFVAILVSWLRGPVQPTP